MERRAILLAAVVVLSAVVAVAPTAAAPGDGATGGQADGCEYPFEATDATGTEVSIPEDPDKVVTLAPSAAQTMWEIGGKDEVVGVSQFATYLDGAGQLANISAPGFGKYNYERIVSLQPDLVLAPNVIPEQSVKTLRDSEITVFKMSKATSIADVREKTTLIGRLTGHCEGAAQTNTWMDENLDAAENAVGDTSKPSALYMLSGGFSTGNETFIHEMITTAGASNLAAQSGLTGYKKISEEVVVSRDPEYLLVGGPNSPYPDQEPYASTTAVQDGNVVSLEGLRTGQPAPRTVVYAVRNLTERFHSDAFGPQQYVSREAAGSDDPTTTPDPTTEATTSSTPDPTETTTVDETVTDAESQGSGTSEMEPTGPEETNGAGSGDTATTDDSGGQGMPGFGPAVAVLALAIGLLGLSRRRR